MVSFTTTLIVDALRPIKCTGFSCDSEGLQYTLYAVMIPFLLTGGVQLINSLLGKPGTGTNVTFSGADGTIY